MKAFLFALFLASVSCLSAQDAGFYPLLAVKLSPLSALDPLTSTFTAGISFRPAPRLGLHFDYGWQYERLKLIGRTSGLADSRYYEVRPEIRYFWPMGKKKKYIWPWKDSTSPTSFRGNTATSYWKTAAISGLTGLMVTALPMAWPSRPAYSS